MENLIIYLIRENQILGNNLYNICHKMWTFCSMYLLKHNLYLRALLQ